MEIGPQYNATRQSTYNSAILDPPSRNTAQKKNDMSRARCDDVGHIKLRILRATCRKIWAPPESLWYSEDIGSRFGNMTGAEFAGDVQFATRTGSTRLENGIDDTGGKYVKDATCKDTKAKVTKPITLLKTHP